MAGRPKLQALSSVKPVSFSGAVYRVVLDRLRNQILSTEGNRHFQGRYHMAGETGILYTSLKQDVAMEEVQRHAPADILQDPLVCGEIRIHLNRVLDLTRTSVLEKLGISKADLISTDYALPHAVSLLARRAGFEGMIVPSATGRGENLIVFEYNLGEGCRIAIAEIRKM